MKKWIVRLIYGLLFAVPLMLVTYALAQASPVQQGSAPVESAQTQDCQACHPAFQAAWEQGIHGKAGSNPAFQKAWMDQGKPEECLACHVTGYDPVSKTWKAVFGRVVTRRPFLSTTVTGSTTRRVSVRNTAPSSGF